MKSSITISNKGNRIRFTGAAANAAFQAMSNTVLLPEQCFSVNESKSQIVILKQGEQGYHEFTRQPATMTPAQAEELCREMNTQLDVTQGQRRAMEAGSFTGNWNSPATNPNNYTPDGKWQPV